MTKQKKKLTPVQKAAKKKRLPKQTKLPKCKLCGKKTNLIQTQCCDQWICDDEEDYELFSYERNSCHRNHRRYTLCGHHHAESHSGDWQTCQECRNDFETEMYVYYGTNEYNFTKLHNPPHYEPSKCSKCKKIINMGKEGYSMQAGKYLCSKCTDFKLL
jgi:hypothetical protein